MSYTHTCKTLPTMASITLVVDMLPKTEATVEEEVRGLQLLLEVTEVVDEVKEEVIIDGVDVVVKLLSGI